MTKINECEIVWHECTEGSDIGRRFYVPEYEGFLPFLISGEEIFQFTNGIPVELREVHLLRGLLYGLYSKHFRRAPGAVNRDVLLNLLEMLRKGFHFNSLRKTILDVAYDVRQKIGNEASRFILETGCELLPDSSDIKSDLVFDLWEVACEHEGKEAVYFEEIVDLIPMINLSQILPGAKEVVCYYGLCAYVFLNRSTEIETYLEAYIYPNVSYSNLKVNIKNILEHPDRYQPQDMLLKQGV